MVSMKVLSSGLCWALYSICFARHSSKLAPLALIPRLVCSEQTLLWYFVSPPWLDIEYRLENPGGEMTKLLQHWDVRTAVRCDCLPGWLAHYRLVKQRDKATEQGVLVRLYLICLSLLKPKTFPTPWQLQIIWNCTPCGLVNSWVILLAKYPSAIPAVSSCLTLFLFFILAFNGY